VLRDRGLKAGLDARDLAGAAQAFHEAEGRRYYYLQSVRFRLKEAQDAVGYILVDAKSSAAYTASHHNWPHRSYQPRYDDAEAVKLEHASYVFGTLEKMELALNEFLLKDELRSDALLSPTSRAELSGRSSGYRNRQK
jgi:hypothetical protein